MGLVLPIILIAPVSASSYQPPHQLPGPAADRLLFKAFDVDRAPLDMEAGKLDLYIFSLKTAAAEKLRVDPRFELYSAPATTLSLVLNPSPDPNGLNPFSLPEVRWAMQYLVDREFIARDIYRGMALPMVSHVSPRDYDFLTIYDMDRGSGIVYDPEYARDMISRAMIDAGAGLEEGIWHFQGEPIRIRFIGRVEDERREIADLVRSELEKAGFMVAISYRPFAAATITVYATDPQAFEWHIYTEGWGRIAPQRYDFATVNQMNAPWLGNMPGWLEAGFWQYTHEELDELGKKLYRGEFSSYEERNRIYRRMSELGLEESVRIWLATVVNSYPAQKNVQGITRDLVAGPRSPLTFREIHVSDAGEVTIGHLWVWTERTTWNPVGGLGDIYSVDIWRQLHDPPLWNHPFTGIPQPFRATFQVETAGPDDTLTVPADAVTWNTDTKRWEEVGTGVEAISRVVFDYTLYFQSNWHHGEPINMADVVYSIAQGYELAYDPDKSRIEMSVAVTSRPYLDTFRGYRILDENRIEVYVDFWHFHEDYIASYASPAGLSMPWEILAAMDEVVFGQRRAAYSDTAATRFNVPWLSLVMDRDCRLVLRTLREFMGRDVIPENIFQVNGSSLVSEKEAMERYQSALEWFERHGNLVISNGPFFLSAYDPPAQYAELRAFREENYPYRPGEWYYGDPPAMFIDAVMIPELVPGEEGEFSGIVEGPGRLGVYYLFVDPVTDEVLQAGETESDPVSGRFQVPLDGEFTAQLFPGLYRLYLVAYSDEVALISEYRAEVEVVP